MAWNVIIAKPAQKQAAKFPVKGRAKIGSAVTSMADDPFSGDAVKLAGEDNLWRRRVGSYRVFFRSRQGTQNYSDQRHFAPDF